MPQTCCVPNCKSVWVENCKISFHNFPRDAEIRQCWLNILAIKTLNWQTKPRVCSKHFNQDDYVVGGNRRKLSKFALPRAANDDAGTSSPQIKVSNVENLPSKPAIPQATNDEAWTNSAQTKTSNTEKKLLMMWENQENISSIPNEQITIMSPTKNITSPIKVSQKRKAKTPQVLPAVPIIMSWTLEQETLVPPTTSTPKKRKKNPADKEENYLESERVPCNQCISYLKTINILENEVSYLKRENERLQQSAATKNLAFDLARFATDDKKISFYTGFQTFQILLLVFKWVLPSGNTADIGCYNSKSSSRKHSKKLSAENQFFLTLLRLRRGMSIETLSDLFCISKATVNNIFLTWINLMYLRLGCLDIWPNREILIERTTASLKEKFQNIIGSIDCTEFNIQSPSSLVKQSQCFSNYKSTTTLKCLLMIEPGGSFIYISPLYTGSISDKALLKKSGFLSILKEKIDEGSILPGDTILADKGFNVIDLFADINLNINIPVFRVGGMQFTSVEVDTTRKIAQERIHVERAIGRLKTYKFLTLSKIPISSLSAMEQIYTVCAILCNFKHSLI